MADNNNNNNNNNPGAQQGAGVAFAVPETYTERHLSGLASTRTPHGPMPHLPRQVSLLRLPGTLQQPAFRGGLERWNPSSF
jgi:hypothetical protein